MNWLHKLPGFQQTPYGFEWRLLRLMPTVCLAGTLLPALMAWAARFFITEGSAAELVRRIQLFDFLMIGLVIFVWTGLQHFLYPIRLGIFILRCIFSRYHYTNYGVQSYHSHGKYFNTFTYSNNMELECREWSIGV